MTGAPVPRDSVDTGGQSFAGYRHQPGCPGPKGAPAPTGPDAGLEGAPPPEATSAAGLEA